MAKQVVIYLRVSTKSQDTDNQLPSLEKWVSDRGYEIVDVYQEQESAWRDGHQRELARLIRDLPKHKVDILLVWSLDRLTRQGSGPLLQLIAKFALHNVDVVTYQETWTEQEGIMKELLLSVYGFFAKYESTRLSKRVLAGLERAKSQGKTLGRRPGSKDKSKRRRTGYLLRYATKKTPES